jgi:hypothetical protein
MLRYVGDFLVGVASAGATGRCAEEVAHEERLEGAREDGAPSLQPGELLRTLGQAAEEVGGGERAGGRLCLGESS